MKRLVDLAQVPQNFGRERRVERGGDLVQQKNLGIHRQCACQRDALPLTSRKLGWIFWQRLAVLGLVKRVNVYQRAKLPRPLERLGRRNALHVNRTLRDVPEDRLVRPEIEFLKYDADARPVHVLVNEHLDDPVVRLDDLVLPEIDGAVLDVLEEIQAGRNVLAGSARAADGDSLAVVDDQELNPSSTVCVPYPTVTFSRRKSSSIPTTHVA